MKPPVVGYVLRMFPQASETFIANEILGLERLGLQVRIYSYRKTRANVPHESVRLIRAPITYLPDPLYRHPRMLLGALVSMRGRERERYRTTMRYVLAHSLRARSLDTFRRFLQAACLADLIEDSDVEHLHAHFAHGATRLAMLTSMLTGLPFSFTAHARDIYSKDVDFPLFREKMERARFAVTVSRYNSDFLAEKLGPSANGNLLTLYNGIDLRKFSPDPDAERANDLILAVGRLVEKKGFSHLIEACRILRRRGRQFRCEIVGGGELRGRLEREIRRKRLMENVRLVGPRSQEELPSYLRRAAVLVMPAVQAKDGNRDALPTVLIEALACGTPVVASHLTGIPEIVDHRVNGLLAAPGDSVALAEAIDQVLADRDLRRRFGAAGRLKAERLFNIETNIPELAQMFRGSIALPELIAT